MAVVPVVLCGGTAYAFWTATGTGSARVSGGTAAALVVGAGTAPANLYPGRVVDLPLSLSNSNPYPVNLTRLTSATVTSSDETACPGSTNVTFPSAVTTGLSSGGYTLPTAFNVPAGGNSAATLSGFLTMRAEAPDGCQGKTFTVNLSFAGSQA